MRVGAHPTVKAFLKAVVRQKLSLDEDLECDLLVGQATDRWLADLAAKVEQAGVSEAELLRLEYMEDVRALEERVSFVTSPRPSPEEQ
ncbi:hypothetical protein [Botrimarina sp.]|uniref:hypothetical protein n=1 Tax=Botrimarina sp. TaxID=2795802 RepID=UPI0032F05E75